MFDLSHNKLNFQTVQPNTMSNLLKSCNVNKAAGIDNVSGRFLKDGADVLGIPITQICNLSIRLCHFPKDCKAGKLKPLYKKGTNTDPKNFRPMSLLQIGFSNHSIKWFQSYLSNKSFRVNIKSKYSSTAKIECGVPKGSILGPLLFLLHVNDMKQAVDCDLFLYADDSCLVYQHKDVSKIEQNLIITTYP